VIATNAAAGDVADALVARLNSRVEVIASEIRGWVKDDRLRMTPILRVARAVADGTLPRDAYVDARTWFVAAAREGKLTERWQAFIGLFRRVFARNGLAWPSSGGDLRNP